jgi:hypothetical protein
VNGWVGDGAPVMRALGSGGALSESSMAECMDMAAVQASQVTSRSSTTFATIYDDLFPATLGERLRMGRRAGFPRDNC